MACWRARVVAPVRRAWLAVVASRARRARKGESTGIVDLHRDVQTCGYHDVQVMWGMLGLEDAAVSVPERRKRSPFWTPSFWYVRSSRPAAAR